MKSKEIVNAVIYVRVSSVRQEYERQIKELKNYCAKNSISVEQIFKEKISGKSKAIDRVEFDNALNYVKNNKIDKFIVWEFSRLGRDSIQIQQAVQFMHKYCCSCYIHTMNLNTLNDKCEQTMEGKLIVNVLSAIAEIEVDNIKNRLNSGRKNYIDNGGKLGRKVGYSKPITETKNYKSIVELLNKNVRIGIIQKSCGVSSNTIRKVRETLKDK